MNGKRGRPFEPGNHYGKGRPKGSRNKARTEAQQILQEYAVPLIRKSVHEALRGDRVLLRACLDRIAPPLRYQPPSFLLGPIRTVEEIMAATHKVSRGVASGKLSPEQADTVLDGLKLTLEGSASLEFDERLRNLEDSNLAGLEPLQESSADEEPGDAHENR